MKELTILETSIRRDSAGRFCLNDLHRAAGSEPTHKPSNWLRLDTTQGLTEEISNCSDLSNRPIEVEAGRHGGTYVVKELVYAYAMWISPKFHLAVIRAFDALVTRQVSAAPSAPSEHLYVEQFWEAYEHLVERGEYMNYSDKSGLIAINLTSMILAARRYGFPVVQRSKLSHVLKTSVRHPFVGHQDQYYRGRRIPRCWVFRQEASTSDAALASSLPHLIEPVSAIVFSQNRHELAGQCTDIALHVGAAANALAGVGEALRKHAMEPHQAKTLLSSLIRDLGAKIQTGGADWC